MRERWWPTTSWSSRAIRSRSWVAARSSVSRARARWLWRSPPRVIMATNQPVSMKSATWLTVAVAPDGAQRGADEAEGGDDHGGVQPSGGGHQEEGHHHGEQQRPVVGAGDVVDGGGEGGDRGGGHRAAGAEVEGAAGHRDQHPVGGGDRPGLLAGTDQGAQGPEADHQEEPRGEGGVGGAASREPEAAPGWGGHAASVGRAARPVLGRGGEPGGPPLRPVGYGPVDRWGTRPPAPGAGAGGRAGLSGRSGRAAAGARRGPGRLRGRG